MFSRVWSSFSRKNQSIQSFYNEYKTAFTVVTTLVGTSAAWMSFFARQKHNQKLEKDIKEINETIAQIPKENKLLYDRMDMIIVGGSALLIGYLSCAVKHKTVNYYRYWNAQKAASTAMKRTELLQGESIASELVTKEEIQTLEKSNRNLFRYYFQSSKQSIQHILSSVGSSCFNGLSKACSAGKTFILKNKAFYEWVLKVTEVVSKRVHKVTNTISVQYNKMMYQYNLHAIQKKKVKMMMEGEKEVINKGNTSSVIK